MEGVQLHIVLCRALAIFFSVAATSLLIVSQYKQNWISYNFVITGSQSATVLLSGNPVTITITYTFTTAADVGLWTTYYSINKQYSREITGILENGTITGTLDSATSGYFTEAAVKACQGLAILASISTLACLILSLIHLILIALKSKPFIIKLNLSQKQMKIIDIAILSTAAFTVLTATIALSVVRSQFKEGMELDTSFYIAIAALLSSVVTLVFSIVAFKINKNLVGSQKE